MACPFFYPTTRLENTGWVVPPRLPLGDAFAGECRAGANAIQPDEAHARQICNTGYGRGCCERFPHDAAVDAVRFHVARDTGERILIQYVFEKDCWPIENGQLEFAAAPDEIRGSPETILRGQAAAFLESYLRLRRLATSV